VRDGFGTYVLATVGDARAAPATGHQTPRSPPWRSRGLPSLWAQKKAAALIPGKAEKHFELPQIARYLTTQKYDRHQDAFNLATESGA
jgi:hypothetical protein